MKNKKDVENTMSEIFGSIATLYMLYGIRVNEGAGKVVLDLLKSLEKQLGCTYEEVE